MQITGEIKSSYFSYHLLVNKKKSLQLLINNLQLHFKRVTDLYKEDLIKKSDLLETELKMVEAKMNVETVKRKIEEEKIRFNRLTTYDVNQIESNYHEIAGTFNESVDRFASFHPTLKNIGHQVRLLQLQKKIVSGKYLPQVAGFAQLHYGRPGIDFFKNQWSLYFQGGLSASMKLFDWHKKKQDHQVADASIRQLENRKQELLIEVKKNLKQLYTGLRSIESQLTLAKQLASTAGEDAQLKEELYKENQSANIDYLSALINKERYEAMQQEFIFQGQLLKMTINMLVGGK
jgi:outer membrane protein TolC